MFNLDKFNNPMVTNPSESLHEAINGIYTAMAESNGNILATNSTHTQLLEAALAENGNVYDDSIKSILTESAKDVTAQIITDLETAIGSFQQVETSLKTSIAQLVKDNTSVVQKYQPLLKQLDTSKSSYTVPKYTLDKLSTSEMLSRFTLCITKEIGLDMKATTEPIETIEQVINQWNQNPEQSLNTIKQALLGVPKTISVNDNFYELARNMLVDPKATETRYFNDEVFGTLLNVGLDIQSEEAAAIGAELENELSELREMKKALLTVTAGNEYANTVIVKFYIMRKMAISYGFSLIVEVLQLRYRIIEEKSLNYRKVVVNTYETLIAPSGGQITESYVPSADSDIGLFHTECAGERDLF